MSALVSAARDDPTPSPLCRRLVNRTPISQPAAGRRRGPRSPTARCRTGEPTEAGATQHRTMQHSRHRSVHVFRGSVRDLNLLDGDNPVARVGL
jgi:hypothetical protein